MSPIVLPIISIVISGIAIIASYVIARKYGDLAGTKAAIEHEKEKEALARKAALVVLRNEVSMLKRYAEYNTGVKVEKHLPIQRIYSMPTEPFEAAFLIKDSPFPNVQIVDIEVVADYITAAKNINNYLDFYADLRTAHGIDEGSRREDALAQIKSESENIIGILEKIDQLLGKWQ